jgi:hypothetical protein
MKQWNSGHREERINVNRRRINSHRIINSPDTWGKESKMYNPNTGRLIKIGGQTYDRLREEEVI